MVFIVRRVVVAGSLLLNSVMQRREVVLIHGDQVDVILADKLLPSKFACVQGAHGKIRKPKPVLWGIDEADDVGRAVHSYIDTLPAYCADNHQVLMRFLSMYSASKDTYQTYRRELERWVQWCWLVRQVDMLQALRDDVLAFLAFCKSPPHHWIGHKLSARFLNGDFHPDWHLFVIRKNRSINTSAISVV